MVQTLPGLLLPFLGTSLGAACVFFLSGSLSKGLSRALTGFAATVVCGLFFDLGNMLIPSMVLMLVILLVLRKPLSHKETEA